MSALLAEPWAAGIDAKIYDRIVKSGALEGERVELIDGIILQMSPQSPEHALVIERLTRHIASATGRFRVQLPLQASETSVPEPDLVVTSELETRAHHPRTALLVVEVAVASQHLDRGRKAEVYAAAGIPTYWLIDVESLTVELRTEPHESGYRTARTLGRGEQLPTPCDGVGELALTELFAGL